MILRRLSSKLERHRDRFLNKASGVIHVGANAGQERGFYETFGLPVVWIEPIPEVFDALEQNLTAFPNQRAIQALITDCDGKEYPFHIASNSGASSSIHEFKAHSEIWPEVTYTKTISLTSITMASLLKKYQIDPSTFDALILDTQGSELLVLKGAVPVLHNFRFVKTEVSDFESYAGGCQLAEIDLFMKQQGYREYSRHKFASRPGGGGYFDIVYERRVI